MPGTSISRLARQSCLVAFCLVSSDVLAQSAKTFAANSSNSNILLVSFNPPGVTVVNTDSNRRTSIQGITVRDDGVDGVHLIACDSLGREVLLYPNASGNALVINNHDASGGPARPDGPSVDPEGNLFLISSATGNAEDSQPQVWVFLRDEGCPDPFRPECLPGGYRAPLGLLDGTFAIGGKPVEVNLLEDTLFSTAPAAQPLSRELLVLVGDPPMVLRYPAEALRGFIDALRLQGPGQQPPAQIAPEILIYPPDAAVQPQRRFPAGAHPSGFAFAPGRKLYVTSEGGVIFIFNADGTRLRDAAGNFVDFASGLGNGKFKIAVGQQDGESRAVVADRNNGEILRFTIQSDGTGQLDATVTAGVQHPVGVGTTASNNVVTPAGAGVAVQATNIIESTFEEVALPGVTHARALFFTDPREGEPGATSNPTAPLHRPLLLSEISAEFPAVQIPSYVRAFRKGQPDTGPPTFILVVMDTNAGFNGIIEHFSEESLILGYEPECDAAEPSFQPRMFWAPDPTEPPIVEGPVLTDFTVECGSDRGWTKDMSFFLGGARDTRLPHEIAATKLARLAGALNSYGCITAGVRRNLQRTLSTAVRKFEQGRFADTIAKLEEFDAQVDGSPSAFSGCSGNVGGELRARARSAIFILGKLI